MGPASTERWFDLRALLETPSKLAPESFEPSDETLAFLQEQFRILVVGAGGLGCELLKDLAFSGFGHIDVIDMDTIDLSNLNRQFLFRKTDIGKSKAEVAAAFINSRIPTCKVTPHHCMIQDKNEDWYEQFHIVVCGLDSIVARRWINSVLHGLLKYEDGELDQTSVIPLVDGGTEGFKGNYRVIMPGMTACIECTLELFPPKVTYPMCTIAHTPRLPEHCIEYVKVLMWPKENPFGGADTSIDGDDPDHIAWIYQQALRRATTYGITGVTHRLTQGVVKNIIPAVASTNATVAAACATECLKLATHAARCLSNYCVFNCSHGVYTYAYEHERKESCVVCSTVPQDIDMDATDTLQTLLDKLEGEEYQMLSPGVRWSCGDSSKSLYMRTPPSLEEKLRPNLAKTFAELGLESGSQLLIADTTRATASTIVLRLRGEME